MSPARSRKIILRLIVGLIIWVALFGLLVRNLSTGWGFLLYIVFVTAAMFFVARERRRIVARRRSLEDELEENRRDLADLMRQSARAGRGEEE